MPSSAIHLASASCLVVYLAIATAKLLVFHWKKWSTAGRIRLPDGPREETKTTRKAALYRQLMDQMNADLQEDGDVVDEAQFWRSIRLPRFINATVSAILFSTQVYRHVIFAHQLSSPIETFRLVTESTTVAVIVALSCSTVLASSIETFGISLQYLFSTAGLLAIHFYATIITRYLTFDAFAFTFPLNLATLIIAVVLVLVVGTTTQGPRRHRDFTRVYNQAVAEKLKELGGERFEANVMTSGRAIIGCFFSAHMLSVVKTIISRDQIDLHELPILPGDMQTESRSQRSLARDTPSQRGAHASASSLLWSTLWSQRELWITSNLCLLIERALAYSPYWCLNRILAVLDGAGPRESAWLYASLYVVLTRMKSWTSAYRGWDITLFRLNPGLRSHLIYLLYRKLLTRNVFATTENKETKSKESKALTKPDILNLVSSDAHHLEGMMWTVGDLIDLVLSLAIGCIFLWYLLGVSAAWGVAASFLAYPPAYLLSKWELRLFDKSRGASDSRISAIQETLQTIQMVKMSGYERYTFDRLNRLRDQEFRYQYWARVIGFLSAALYSAAPALVILISFGHYTIVAKHRLTASVAFTSIAVFAELRPALTLAPKHLADLFKSALAIRRIHTFLRTEDIEPLEESADNATSAHSDASGLVIQGDISWNKPAESKDAAASTIFTLRDLNLSFTRGEISLVAGKAGAGKTLLLLALLGEVTLLKGEITYAFSPMLAPDDIHAAFDWDLLSTGAAYVPQTAWLQSMSIRDNILFGLPLEHTRYKWVLYACALLPDLELLADSDLTEIGERGKTLSGGQKARVSLARAMYSRASVIVLDDVLSAVDASTCQHLIHHCFLNPLILGRTIVIASHAVEQLAPISYRAMFLEEGRCVWQGTGPELLITGHMSHLRAEKQESQASATASSAPSERGSSVQASSKSHSTQSVSRKASDDFEIRIAPAKTPRQMLLDENRAHGAVEGKYWLELIRMCGGRLFLTTFVLLTLGSVLGPVLERYLVESWTDDAANIDPRTWIIAYSILSTLAIVMNVGREMSGFYGGFQAMKATYVHMLDRVLRSPMQFFVKTRAGSIVQRFSGDLESVLDCAELVGETTMVLTQALVSLASITWYAGWRFLLAMVVLVMLFWRPASWYRVASRQVRRLMSITPGPVNAHFGETIVGAPVIRAFGAQGIHMQQMLRLTNMFVTTQIMSYMIGRWTWFYTEAFDLVVVTATWVLILTNPSISAAKAGFIIGFAATIADEMHTFVVCAREWDLKGVTLERVAEYRNLETEKIPSMVPDRRETESLSEMLEHDDDWPRSGKIEVSGIHARYAPDLPDILSNVSFNVESGERVGIVGATGCGKSTLAKAFLSFIDVTEGSIKIDDKDLKHLPLDIARGRLGIIGQDPMLVSGSLRLNLDVEGVHSDEELFAVLRRVSLLEVNTPADAPTSTGIETESSSVTAVGDNTGPKNRNVFQDLDYEIVNAGDNLSSGEKQLIVLARALLQRKRVLILDEATASIDTKTDLIVTRLVHEEFQGSTVLIIAHRLRTVMPCDKILVMDKGRIIQYDSPRKLLELGEGLFHDLCMAAGSDEYDQLRSLTRTV